MDSDNEEEPDASPRPIDTSYLASLHQDLYDGLTALHSGLGMKLAIHKEDSQHLTFMEALTNNESSYSKKKPN